MEQWGYAVAGRQFVSVDYRVNLAKKWDSVPGAQFVAQEPEVQVLGWEPHHLSWLILGVWPSLAVGLDALVVDCSLEANDYTLPHVPALLELGTFEGSPDHGNSGSWRTARATRRCFRGALWFVGSQMSGTGEV